MIDKIEKIASCDDDVEPQLLPVAEARSKLLAALEPIIDIQVIGLRDGLGRVLARDVMSSINVPSHANSAMDGYAINAISVPVSGIAQLELVGTAFAGQPFEGVVQAGQAVRIFTGAIMPQGCDTVVIQEHANASDSQVSIDSDVVAGKNVRQAGEDVQQGQLVLSAGKRLEAADIGVIASLGIAKVSVCRKLKVAFFTTGDELVALDEYTPVQSLEPGKLFDSNRYTLASLLQEMGVDVIDMGIVGDNENETRKALQQAASIADVVVSSGGVSAGDADFVTRVFHELGRVHFWKIAMRPGRPLAFGQIGDAAFFGLPGNPVAVMVTFLEFVKPALRHLSGMHDLETLTLKAVAQSKLRKTLGRVEYQRGIMRVDSTGSLLVESTGKQGAGRLSSMSQANCLIVIDASVSEVNPGDTVGVQPFRGLLGG